MQPTFEASFSGDTACGIALQGTSRHTDIRRSVSSDRSEEYKNWNALPRVVRRTLRGRLALLLDDQRFDSVMGLIICLNIVVMIVETDQAAPCANQASTTACESDVILYCNYCFLGIYAVEAALRIVCLRCTLFYSSWNVLDLIVVFAGLVDVIMNNVEMDDLPGPNVSLLRIFRIFRLLRAVRVFRKIPALNAMLRGFVSAMYAMFWGFMMIIVLLMIFSILCVDLVHPITLVVHKETPDCKEAFSNVWYCMLMFFQTLVAGDSWGECALPVIKDTWWTFGIFAGALTCVQIGFLNLILAVIVECAANAKEEDEEEMKKIRTVEETKARHRIEKMLRGIDEDQSGFITREELIQGFEHNHEMQSMFRKLSIDRDELEYLFDLMDVDDTNELSCGYLMENLRTLSSADQRKSLSMIRLQVAEQVRLLKKMDRGFFCPDASRSNGTCITPQVTQHGCPSHAESTAASSAHEHAADTDLSMLSSTSPVDSDVTDVVPKHGASAISCGIRAGRSRNAKRHRSLKMSSIAPHSNFDLHRFEKELRQSLDESFSRLRDDVAAIADTFSINLPEVPPAIKVQPSKLFGSPLIPYGVNANGSDSGETVDMALDRVRCGLETSARKLKDDLHLQNLRITATLYNRSLHIQEGEGLGRTLL